MYEPPLMPPLLMVFLLPLPICIFYIRNKFTYTAFYSSSVTLMHLHPSLQCPHHLGLLLLLQRVANVEQTTSSAVMVSATIVYLRLTAWSHSGQKYLRVYSLLWSCFPALHSATVSTDHRVVSVSSSSRSTRRWSSLAQTNATTNPALQCFGWHVSLFSQTVLYTNLLMLHVNAKSHCKSIPPLNPVLYIDATTIVT